MKNIHILPTDKLTKISISEKTNTMVYNKDKHDTLVGFINKNIYITSDEEIKEGDWYIFPLYKKGFAIKRYNSVEHFSKEPCISLANLKAKKIILTTDQDLIKDGVQAIDDDFLEWFVKNPSCEKVEVEINSYMDKNISDSITFTDYKIIIPKEEPKQETLEEAKNICIQTGLPCGMQCLSEEVCNRHKQETLEEVAERLFPNKMEEYDIFLMGAKWQQEPEQFFNDDRVKTLEKSMEYLLKKQERMYSEEEVEDLIYNVCGTTARLQGITLNGNHIDTAYKQFKNK